MDDAMDFTMESGHQPPHASGDQHCQSHRPVQTSNRPISQLSAGGRYDPVHHIDVDSWGPARTPPTPHSYGTQPSAPQYFPYQSASWGRYQEPQLPAADVNQGLGRSSAAPSLTGGHSWDALLQDPLVRQPFGYSFNNPATQHRPTPQVSLRSTRNPIPLEPPLELPPSSGSSSGSGYLTSNTRHLRMRMDSDPVASYFDSGISTAARDQGSAEPRTPSATAGMDLGREDTRADSSPMAAAAPGANFTARNRPHHRPLTVQSAYEQLSRIRARAGLQDEYDSDDSELLFGATISNPSYRGAAGDNEYTRQLQRIRATMTSGKKVASKEAIASLEKMKLCEVAAEEMTCVICYNPYGTVNPEGELEEPTRLPKCKHIFGDRCIKKWLEDSDSCPYCRDKLPSEVFVSKQFAAEALRVRRQSAAMIAQVQQHQRGLASDFADRELQRLSQAESEARTRALVNRQAVNQSASRDIQEHPRRTRDRLSAGRPASMGSARLPVPDIYSSRDERQMQLMMYLQSDLREDRPGMYGSAGLETRATPYAFENATHEQQLQMMRILQSRVRPDRQRLHETAGLETRPSSSSEPLSPAVAVGSRIAAVPALGTSPTAAVSPGRIDSQRMDPGRQSDTNFAPWNQTPSGPFDNSGW